MDKYVVAPPSGSTNNSVGAVNRKWKKGYFDELPGWQEYLAESTGYGIVSGCTPTISGLTVTVAAGIVHLADGTRKELSASTVTLDTADSTNPRIDLVYINADGEVAKVTGTASASPVVPTLPSGGISVATVSVAANASTGTVTDMRGMLARWYNTGVVNVKDFGAVGDGVHDDTVAIQASLNHANITGKTLIFPKGTYVTSETLNIASCIVDGCNSSIIYTGTDKAINITDGWMLKIYNLLIQGTNNADYGIYADGKLNASLFQNIIINGGFKNGIYLLNSWQSRLNGIYIYDCTEYGLYMTRGYNAEINYLRVSRCPINAYFLSMLSCKIQTIDCSAATDVALQINSCRNVTVKSLYYEDSTNYKANKVIRLGEFGSYSLTFSDMYMALSKENAVYIDMSTDGYIEDVLFDGIIVNVGNNNQTIINFPAITSTHTRTIAFTKEIKVVNESQYTINEQSGYGAYIINEDDFATTSWVTIDNGSKKVINRLAVPKTKDSVPNRFDGTDTVTKYYESTTWGYYQVKTCNSFKGIVELITEVGRILYFVDTSAQTIWTQVEKTIDDSYRFVGSFNNNVLELHQNGGTIIEHLLVKAHGNFT